MAKSRCCINCISSARINDTNIIRCKNLGKKIRYLEARIIGIKNRGNRLSIGINEHNKKVRFAKAEEYRKEIEHLNKLINYMKDKIVELLEEPDCPGHHRQGE